MGAGLARVKPRSDEPPRRRFSPAAWVALLGRALKATYQDGCLGMAKGAAYSALLAFFPLLATTAALLLHFRANWVAQTITTIISKALPPGTEDLVFNYFSVRGHRPVLLPITAVLLSLWAASGSTVSLMQGFTAVYRIPTGRPAVRERVIAILLVFSAAIPALLASALLLLGGRAERWAVGALGWLPQGQELRGGVSLLYMLARYLITLGSLAVGAMILFRFGPNRPQSFRRVWPGAVLATLLWLGATLGFGWYVRNLGQYNLMYGSIAAAILLLIWMYVLAVIAFIGCEFNATCERAGLWPPRRPPG